MADRIHRHAVSGQGAQTLLQVPGRLSGGAIGVAGQEQFYFYTIDDGAGVLRSYELFIVPDAEVLTFPEGYGYAGITTNGFHFASREVTSNSPEE